ncbi:unnamed protein product [Thelazia callipaeda]|uniref:Membrane-associated guanylate kinase, WW and PDZ domain-containing protein 2 n=1 Tax=Thelazia callipaeda TaxID=103827 RepID=A0A0N5DB14_THECL|nr:unnamed protein product [Thelazia callipaeda]
MSWYYYGTSKPTEDETEMVSDAKEALPSNWEIAYSDQGEKYFVDHNTGTTQWEDPRDLPASWEKVDDGAYGTLYVDHISKRAQYKRPSSPALQKVSEVRRSYNHSSSFYTLASYHDSSNTATNEVLVNGSCSNPQSALYSDHSSPSHAVGSVHTFTRDPSKLRGELITTRILRGPKGLGFTLIGNDGSSSHDEFLQIKNVIPGGPAYQDGVLQKGDVLVYVNSECMLGATQAHACLVFQSINVGELVTLQICRGYALHFDPSDKIVTENAYITRSDDEREIIIRKDNNGFGFTFFDSIQGQRVKKILCPEKCENLLEGDTLLEMRTTYPYESTGISMGEERVTNFRGMPHHELISILNDCPIGFWAKLLVRRNSPKHRSRTPSATFRYGEQRPTPAPILMSRSKTPIAHPLPPTKAYFHSSTTLPVPKSVPSQPVANNDSNTTYGARNTIPRQHERCPNEDIYENFSDLRPSSTSLGFSTPNYVPMTVLTDPDTETIKVNLNIKPTGFGFRVVGGTEEGTVIKIGPLLPGGAAANDGRLRQGDEIIKISGENVVGESHAMAIQLMQKAAVNGHVELIIRRNKTRAVFTYDVVLHRAHGNSFGFIITSALNNNGSTIGRIMEGSPAASCGQLHVGDRILAVNGNDIAKLPQRDVIKLIKNSGLSVRLTISSSLSSKHMVSTATNEQSSQTPSRDYHHGPSRSHSSDFAQYRYVAENDYVNSTSLIPSKMGQVLVRIELARGPKGFGFSIRGGREFDSMPLFVLKMADDGPAALDGRLRIGDQLIEINGRSTYGMSHTDAIQIIKQSPTVNLLVRSTP